MNIIGPARREETGERTTTEKEESFLRHTLYSEGLLLLVNTRNRKTKYGSRRRDFYNANGVWAAAGKTTWISLLHFTLYQATALDGFFVHDFQAYKAVLLPLRCACGRCMGSRIP